MTIDDTQEPQNDAVGSENTEGGENEESEIKSGQVFDISDDNISPASNIEDEVPRPITRVAIPPLTPKLAAVPQQNIPPIVQSKVTPDTTDKKEEEQTPVRPFTGSFSNLEMEIGSLIPRSMQPKENPFVHATPPQEKIVTNPEYDQKNLRTYEGDVANILAHTKTSTASIAIAESRKTNGSEIMGSQAPSHSTGKLLLVLASLLLVGGGIFGAYYFYSKSPLAQKAVPVVPEQTITSLIPADIHTSIAINNLGQAEIISRIKKEISKPISSGSIKDIVLIRENNAVISKVFSTDILKAMNIEPPNILTRTLTPQWMLGVYSNENNEKSVFVVFTTNYFQNAFSGMLQWEKIMPDDIKQYLYATPPQGISNTSGKVVKTPTENSLLPNSNIATSTNQAPIASTTKNIATSTNKTKTASTTKNTTATSTKITTPKTTASSTTSSTTKLVVPEPTLQSYLTINGQFEDRIVKNKDVRAFKTTSGTILFLYSFIDSNKLIITDKEETLADILIRLEKQTFMR